MCCEEQCTLLSILLKEIREYLMEKLQKLDGYLAKYGRICKILWCDLRITQKESNFSVIHTKIYFMKNTNLH